MIALLTNGAHKIQIQLFTFFSNLAHKNLNWDCMHTSGRETGLQQQLTWTNQTIYPINNNSRCQALLAVCVFVTASAAKYTRTSLNPVPNAQVCIQPFWCDIDIRPPWDRPCLSQTATHARGGGVYYFCQGFLPCMMPSMDGWTGHVMKKASLKMTTASFTICNNRLS